MYRIIALQDKRVLDPATSRPIPAEGLLVEKLSPYWLRRKAERPKSINVTEEPAAPQGG
jgi:hypothetical protein